MILGSKREMGKNPLLLTQKSTYINQNIGYYQYRVLSDF